VGAGGDGATFIEAVSIAPRRCNVDDPSLYTTE
jgi:hypothetical protein